jgi:thiamine-phosphate pyrophosphorylase
MGAMIRGLYAITPEIDTGDLSHKVSLALEGGASLLQYRSKNASAPLREEQARRLKKICAIHRVPFIVNDDVMLAKNIDADGIHLGRDDAPVTEAREILGKGKIIGASCYNDIELARRRVHEGADYVAFGSFFLSPNKPEAVRAPLGLLRVAKSELSVPLVAIGGIVPENAQEVIAAGADAIAVIAGLFDAPDISDRARTFVGLFENAAKRAAV